MLELAVDARNTLGECVLWCERTERVLWTDIEGARLFAFAPGSGVSHSWAMPERLASFAFTADPGRLLLGLASRLAFFDLASGTVTPICTVEAELPDTRLNDGRCDRQGRFVFGTFNQAQPKPAIGAFYRLDASLTLERLPLPATAIANSICFSPDGATMYFCDSLEKKIRSCDYDPASGRIGAQRVFADLAGYDGEPDGSTIDAEGYLWNALWGAGKIVRFAPDGSVDRELAIAATQPSCVAFGGVGLDRLFVTSARVGLTDPQPFEGGLFCAATAGIRGLPECVFAGS